MRGPVARVAVLLACLLAVSVVLPSSAWSIPGFSDCKEAPTPEVPGRGIAGFFSQPPDVIPDQGDPFAEGSTTTIYQQYGFAGLRWHTYDLGCGPDAMRAPDAVIGTAMSNWVMQAPIALTALTGSLTQVAFEPSFLGSFDAVVEHVSSALHDSLFASWIPAIIALLGAMIILKARRSSLATTAGAIGWALIVVFVTTALFRWPVEAGQAADATVTGTLGAVVSQLDGHGPGVDPGTAVASNVSESIFYRAWLAGALGSPDSATAKKYGPELFKAQALTWHEASILESDPEKGKQIIEDKKQAWKDTADKIHDEDPEAYEYLTGKRSETRIGYAILSALGAFLALPFLLVSALLLLGCFLIVRLAVMLFPAFATLGAFPASRGLVIGLARTVGAALVNAIIFGIGAGVTIAVLGILFHPGGGAPAWLGLVLMPVFSFIMWMALRPFRRLTSMVSPNSDHFRGMAGGSLGSAVHTGSDWAKRLAIAGIGAATGGAAAGAVAASVLDEEEGAAPPDRVEARPAPFAPSAGSSVSPPVSPEAQDPPPWVAAGHSQPATHRAPIPAMAGTPRPEARALNPGFVPTPSSDGVPLPPTEPEWYDGEDVYTIYRPDNEDEDVDSTGAEIR
ncbi:putative membrane protein [Nocardioides ginsengisegetis]|uniref:Putative membrane protein n=1 Tax=Nocardioides ginsengisegetis TaxID=661491 RepID=A0A7W3J375_9ACTN|nr:hypothetical protein [Nocardioides ginsengisegetis]MBA8805448.1 putative membrane protein [Nocardioides ginsengisegetis]